MGHHVSRRSMLAVTTAATCAPALANASMAAREGSPSGPRSLGKYTWTLTAPTGVSREAFQKALIAEIAAETAKLVPSTVTASVTPQESNAYSNSLVKTAQGERGVDAVLEIETSQPFGEILDANEYLLRHTGNLQGWRVHPTVIFDTEDPAPILAPSPVPNLLIFIQRLDGTTPDHFSRNWFIHAGHLDGQEAEDQQTREQRLSIQRSARNRRYVQNRVIEPVTATSWVVHGYTQLFMPAFPPSAGPRYARVHGEDIFEEWPPRIVQGYARRII